MTITTTKEKEMKVVLSNKMTYNCDFDVEVGDMVKVPRPFFLKGVDGEYGPMTLEVKQIGSEYDGDCISVISKV
jgi:hypothetical protein